MLKATHARVSANTTTKRSVGRIPILGRGRQDQAPSTARTADRCETMRIVYGFIGFRFVDALGENSAVNSA
jgi:hypothetical protein